MIHATVPVFLQRVDHRPNYSNNHPLMHLSHHTIISDVSAKLDLGIRMTSRVDIIFSTLDNPGCVSTEACFSIEVTDAVLDELCC